METDHVPLTNLAPICLANSSRPREPTEVHHLIPFPSSFQSEGPPLRPLLQNLLNL